MHANEHESSTFKREHRCAELARISTRQAKIGLAGDPGLRRKEELLCASYGAAEAAPWTLVPWAGKVGTGSWMSYTAAGVRCFWAVTAHPP
jgi:hypothetical protein